MGTSALAGFLTGRAHHPAAGAGLGAVPATLEPLDLPDLRPRSAGGSKSQLGVAGVPRGGSAGGLLSPPLYTVLQSPHAHQRTASSGARKRGQGGPRAPGISCPPTPCCLFPLTALLSTPPHPAGGGAANLASLFSPSSSLPGFRSPLVALPAFGNTPAGLPGLLSPDQPGHAALGGSGAQKQQRPRSTDSSRQERVASALKGTAAAGATAPAAPGTALSAMVPVCEGAAAGLESFLPLPFPLPCADLAAFCGGGGPLPGALLPPPAGVPAIVFRPQPAAEPVLLRPASKAPAAAIHADCWLPLDSAAAAAGTFDIVPDPACDRGEAEAGGAGGASAAAAAAIVAKIAEVEGKVHQVGGLGTRARLGRGLLPPSSLVDCVQACSALPSATRTSLPPSCLSPHAYPHPPSQPFHLPAPSPARPPPQVEAKWGSLSLKTGRAYFLLHHACRHPAAAPLFRRKAEEALCRWVGRMGGLQGRAAWAQRSSGHGIMHP